LLCGGRVVETAFRPGTQNELVRAGVITVSQKAFLRSSVPCSMRDESTFLGRCDLCPDMCGLSRNGTSILNPCRPRQLSLNLKGIDQQ
jgi:hypothetical protein